MKRLMPIVLVLAALVGCSKRAFKMGSGAMEPAIPKGSECVVDFGAYTSASPRRFDIVVFRPPKPKNAVFCFRVVGLPGETVQITEDGLLIDAKLLTPPSGLSYMGMPSGSYLTKTKLSNTQYFLLGDNMSTARDSRYIGPVQQDDILGKVVNIEP